MAKKKKKKSRLRLLILAALVIAALLLGWCGRGWLGGGKSGDERKATTKAKIQPAAALPLDAGPAPRCRLRVDKVGIQLNGAPSTIPGAVAGCKAPGEAELVVTGEAKYGTVEALKKELGSAGIRIYSAGGSGTP